MTTETFYITEEDFIHVSISNKYRNVQILTRAGLSKVGGILKDYYYSFNAKTSDLNIGAEENVAHLQASELQKAGSNFELFNLTKSVANYKAKGTPTDLTVEKIENLLQSIKNKNKKHPIFTSDTILVEYVNVHNKDERYLLIADFEEEALEILKDDGSIYENALADIDDSCFALNAVSDALANLRIVLEE